MQPQGNQSFHRGSDRIIGGVCSGLAEGFHVDPLWVRLAFVVLTFLQGVGVLLYVVLWFLMPERPGARPPAQTTFQSMNNDLKRAWAELRAQFGGARPPAPPPSSTAAEPTTSVATSEVPATGEGVPAAQSAPVTQPLGRNPSFILGAILVALGIAFLAANTRLLEWSVIWPVALMVFGIALLVRNLEKRP